MHLCCALCDLFEPYLAKHFEYKLPKIPGRGDAFRPSPISRLH